MSDRKFSGGYFVKYPMQAMTTYGMSRFFNFEIQKADIPFQERKNPEDNMKAGTQNLETFASHFVRIISLSFGWKKAK
jgi:hypothetical protein